MAMTKLKRQSARKAKRSFAGARGYTALVQTIKDLRYLICEHHSWSVMRDEHCICPVCTTKEGNATLDKAAKLEARYNADISQPGTDAHNKH